jgi:hypothetical protein
MWSEKEKDKMIATANYYLRLNLFVAIPAALGLFFLGIPIVELLFQRGKFTPENAQVTGAVLQVYAFTLIVSSSVRVLVLRCDSHAQWEIRVFADAILELIKPIVPWSIEAWNDYHPMRGAVKLTRLEIEALKQYLGMVIQGCPEEYKVVPKINSDNKREQAEWTEKLKLFGLKNE